MKLILIKINICICFLFMLSCSDKITPTGSKAAQPNEIEIPFAGNAFITQKDTTSHEQITENGLENWTSLKAIISCYFKVNTTGTLNIYLKVEDAKSNGNINATVLGKTYTINTISTKNEYFICSAFIRDTGYIKVDLQGTKLQAAVFATNPSLVIRGTAIHTLPIYASDSLNFYWSRRGPSCHLNYTLPKQDIKFFYSELMVPTGEDKVGSYFMANGFADGYFGIQVNSTTERRVLFSVWEEENKPKTVLVKKGTNVIVGRFDGEGTGGQSFLKYNWKANVNYKFLTKAEPDSAGNTNYTSWFYMPEIDKWELIATFKRQNKSTYLTGVHSFLENFEPDNGYQSRKAFYSNQWVKTKTGNWMPIKECQFSVDATGKNRQRMDFSGGVENGKYFLQNGGFTNSSTVPKTMFAIKNYNTAPVIFIVE